MQTAQGLGSGYIAPDFGSPGVQSRISVILRKCIVMAKPIKTNRIRDV